MDADQALAEYGLEQNHETVGNAMVAVFCVGHVGLLNRPQVPASALAAAGWENVGEGIATVFTVSYTAGTDGVPFSRDIILHLTPILPDGSVKSPSQMENYVDYLTSRPNVPSLMNADKTNYGGMGLILWVQLVNTGWDNAYTVGEEFDEYLHLLQAAYYLDDYEDLPTEGQLRHMYSYTDTGSERTVGSCMIVNGSEYRGPAIYPQLRYSMGFSINGEPIPDPSEFSGKESDLDTMGERDATGYLHRNMVATKYPVKLSYKNIPWTALMDICAKINGPKFLFTFPSPYTCDMQTVEAYAGDRDFETVSATPSGMWLCNLNFSVIQY